VLRAEIAAIDERKMQVNEAIQKMEEKRAAEIERGRREVILERSSQKLIYESEIMPVYTSTPKMLITGKAVARGMFSPELTIRVSASSKIRDELRHVLQSFLDRDITLRELDFQPSD
jgi:hypothetical protein